MSPEHSLLTPEEQADAVRIWRFAGIVVYAKAARTIADRLRDRYREAPLAAVAIARARRLWGDVQDPKRRHIAEMELAVLLTLLETHPAAQDLLRTIVATEPVGASTAWIVALARRLYTPGPGG